MQKIKFVKTNQIGCYAKKQKFISYAQKMCRIDFTSSSRNVQVNPKHTKTLLLECKKVVVKTPIYN